MTVDVADLVIRAAGADDVAALTALRTAWTHDGRADPDFPQAMATWMADEGERRTTWLALVAGRAVGMVSLFEYRRMPKPGRLDSRWGYVGNMFVCEDSRRRGIGSALLAQVISAAHERCYARLVVSPSAQASSLYRHAGFVTPGQTADVDVLLLRPVAER